MADATAIAEHVKRLYAAHGRSVGDSDVFDAYFTAMQRVPEPVVKAAFNEAIEHGGQHPMSAGEVRTIAERIAERRRGEQSLRRPRLSRDAWSQRRSEVRASSRQQLHAMANGDDPNAARFARRLLGAMNRNDHESKQ